MKFSAWIRVLSTLLALLLLGGCYAEIAPSQTEGDVDTGSTGLTVETGNVDSPTTTQFFAPYHSYVQNNVRCAWPTISVYPSSDGKGFYIPTSLRYYSVTDEASFRMCMLPGCNHTDESCPGIIPNMLCFLEAEGMWYAFCGLEGNLYLRRIDPASGERRTLAEWICVPGSSDYRIEDAFYSGGRIFCQITDLYRSDEKLLQYVDLQDGKAYTLARCGQWESGTMEGAWGDSVIVQYTSYTQEPLSLGEYLRENPEHTEEDYYAYLGAASKDSVHEIRCYDLQTMAYTDITNVLQMGSSLYPNLLFSSNSSCYGEYLLYKLEDRICRYSMAEGKAEVLVAAENAINGFLFDGYLHYFTQKDGIFKIHIRDLISGEEMLLENNGQEVGCYFTIHVETADAYIGMFSNGQKAWILKEDYYAERYDAAMTY